VDEGKERAPIWWRPDRGARGPDPALDRGRIADAAIELADRDGLDAVSMRAVAARLSTSASALYRYVDDRSELLDLMADRVAAELRPYPAPGADWLEPTLQLAAAQRTLHERHPWLMALGYRSSGFGPESLAYFDTCLSVPSSSVAPVRAKFEAIALMTGLAALFAQRSKSEESGALTPFPLVALQDFPHLADALAQPPSPPIRDDLFDRAVRSLLLGLLEA
jgi:AcrR family transcriptional regulator